MGDGRSPYGARKKNCKRPFRPDAVCVSLNLFKQFISSTAPVSPMVKMGDGRAPFRSRGAGEKKLKRSFQPGSPADPVKAYKGRTIRIGQALRQDSKLIRSNATGLLKTPLTSQQHTTTMENLPDELLLDIFIRLLAKQLAQMRSVSKSWNALLSHSSFVKSHLDRSINHNKDQILLVFKSKICSCDFKPITAHPSQSPHLEVLTDFNKLPPFNPESGHKIPSHSPGETNFLIPVSLPPHIIGVIGAVNGLICSSYGTSAIHIWNPSLSAVSTLLPCPIPTRSPSAINFRFGFDPKTDDYKVIKLTGIPILGCPLEFSMPHYPFYSIKEWLQVEVYSMRKGSWDVITARFPSHIKKIFSDDRLCVDGRDGHLHWFGGYLRGKTYSETIVAFDLGSQTFAEIPYHKHSLRYFKTIGVLAGKLCVISPRGNGTFEVWVMDEYGVAESWVKRHVFSLYFCKSIANGFTSHNEFLIHYNGSNSSHLGLYDPTTNKTKHFKEFCCGVNYYHSYKIVECSDLYF